MRRPRRGARADWILVCLLSAASAPACAVEAPPPAMVLLPVEGWIDGGADATRIFEERLLIALQRKSDGRVVGARELPGRPPPSARVVWLRFLGEDPETSLFATVIDAESGRTLARRELGPLDTRALPPSLPAEVAAWVRGEPPPAPPRVMERAPTPPPPVISLELAPASRSPVGETLRSELASSLSAHHELAILPTELESTVGIATHRAKITVEAAWVTSRVHHVHRYREGLLVATVTLFDPENRAVIFTHRGRAQVDGRAGHGSDSGAMAELVSEVVRQWSGAFESESVTRRLKRSVP